MGALQRPQESRAVVPGHGRDLQQAEIQASSEAAVTDRTAIQVGDLVQVVHSCCGVFVGAIATVSGFAEPATHPCIDCGRVASGLVRAKFDRNTFPKACPVAWLKRIPPLEELEGTKTDEPMKEPA